MNGLRFIRTQCNISLSSLAMALGVSRQMVSAWENDKKELPQKRVEQLSQYFGLEEKYFGEIDDV
ncbi:helix-turn-helix domain-containing protein [Blautia sp. HCP3S3_G3]|uniref:helix-turn-helix domain-containing protein n=1 Tax=Blautia sp. HCP3S3_G3 TaxID=3438913 RepID=UPI003F89D094